MLLRGSPVSSGLLVLLLGAMLATTVGGAAPHASGVPQASTVDGVVRVELDGGSLDWNTMISVLHADSVSVRLSEDARAAMTEARQGGLDAIGGGQRVYGWNQALGPLKDRPLNLGEQREFQRRVLRSHAAGVGPALPAPVARLALVLRANAMARGKMGVRPELADRMLSMVNAGIVPRMPEIGSLGTGDLQPMAAAGLSMIGERNPVTVHGSAADPAMGLRSAGLPARFTFEAGEALALISGGGVLTARLVAAADHAERAVDAFEGAFAVFLEATRAEQGAFDPRTHAERGIPADAAAAGRIRALVCGSGWMTEQGRRRSGESEPRIQDATSVRATPHILGALRQTLDEVRGTVHREANASTSNPLLFPGDDGYEFVMGGNWDAAALGHRIDTLNAQLTDLGVLSQELSGRLLEPKWSYGLPANLAGGTPGLNSGMVQAQTVAAALVPEMQTAASPAGVLSRPVKGGQEDHNTMAMASMRNLAANLDRLDTVLGVQLMMGAQGVDLMRRTMSGLPLGAGSSAVMSEVRRHIRPLGDDRYLSPDVAEAGELVREGAVSRAVRGAARTSACAA